MAYRALITIQSLHQITGAVENQCYATMHLGEEFKEGEEMAHCLASERTYPSACWLADGGRLHAHFYPLQRSLPVHLQR